VYCYVTCIFVVTHFWLLVVESLLLSKDFKNVNFSLETVVELLDLSHIVREMSFSDEVSGAH